MYRLGIIIRSPFVRSFHPSLELHPANKVADAPMPCLDLHRHTHTHMCDELTLRRAAMLTFLFLGCIHFRALLEDKMLLLAYFPY